MPHYPIVLDLSGRLAVVLGDDDASALTAEKARGLLAAGARVRVIAPRPVQDLSPMGGELEWLARSYRPGDLAGAFLAVVAAGDPALRRAAFAEAEAAAILINTVDDVARCNFLAPALVRRGDLTVAISTGGKAPALAVRLRQRLEAELGEEHARFLAWAGQARPALAAREPDFATRRRLWYELVDSDVLDLLRRGEGEAARARFAAILGVSPAGAAA
jgi:siroheme synthase-like protein